ncbi:MAG: alpha/beta hydrolase, partial [Pseudomonadota bacterium]|nr:alpha/beta hydrolase [Pseudomonadota bacterium]
PDQENSFVLDICGEVGGGEVSGLLRDSGSGPVGVFVHGFRSSMFATKAQFFADHAARRGYDWLRFDLHCHGGQGEPLNNFRVSRAVAELEAVLEMLAGRRLVLVGSSFGGWLSVLVARQFAERIDGMVLIAPAFDFIDHYFAGESPEALTEWRDAGARTFEGLEDGEVFELDYDLLPDARNFRILDRTHDHPFPIHILHGEADETAPVDLSRRFTGLARNGNVMLEVIENGDHSLNEHLSRVAAAIDMHMDKQMTGRSGER